MVTFLQEERFIFSFSSTFCYPDCMSSIIEIKTYKHKIHPEWKEHLLIHVTKQTHSNFAYINSGIVNHIVNDHLY